MASEQESEKIVLYQAFNFANAKSHCQLQLDHGLPFTLRPTENIDPFQYAYSLAQEPAVMCMFYCAKVDKTVIYKLTVRENASQTHTVDFWPVKMTDGLTVAQKAGEFFKRDNEGAWKDAYSNELL